MLLVATPGIAVFLADPFAAAAGDDVVNDRQRFEAARKLAVEDRAEEAFAEYLAIPGGEYAAAELARGEAAEFLTILQQRPQLRESPRALLVEAELMLASERRDEAKAHFHTVAATAPEENWGVKQPGYYPVEPPSGPGGDGIFSGMVTSQLTVPFSRGPGSHRDNWLLRRLIALDLTEDAAREFARLWEIHRANARPYLISMPQRDGKDQPAGNGQQLVRPSGFDGFGLQYALDYAYFLKRAGREDDALEVLLEPLRVMDLDLNPNLTHPEVMTAAAAASYPVHNAPANLTFGLGSGRIGVARKDFIRIACGEFKSAGREKLLLDSLREQIAHGENRARRVLAQVKLNQGDGEAALTLELEYIRRGAFDVLSADYRRGQVYDASGRSAEAIAAFEKVLVAEPAVMHLPDADEQGSEIGSSQPSAAIQVDHAQPGAPDLVRDEVRDRLIRLYGAVGRSDKVLETQLAQVDANESRLDNPAQVEQLAARFKAAGKEARFSEWATGKIAAARSPRVRANLAWQQRDYQGAMKHAAATGSSNPYGWHEWKERFAKLGRKEEREFMRMVVLTNPQDAVARLELLEMDDRPEGLEAIAALEALLAADANSAFPHGKGVWNRTRIKSHADLAYRLMRLYEKNNKLDELRALGLRMAKGEKPFVTSDWNRNDGFGENGQEEFGNACLALAIQHADDKTYQAELAAALKQSRWTGAQAQLERRMGSYANKNADGTKAPPWANVPDRVRVIASCDTVTCTARNERYVYEGLPWGVAVYDLKHAPVTRIVLGGTVTALVANAREVWAGTPEGLFRIEEDARVTAHEALGQVTALGLDGDRLWIGVRGAIMTLDLNTLALRTFAPEEIGLEQAPQITRFEPDREYVWVDGGSGLMRYDRAADAWNALANPGKRDPVHLIGIIDGDVWADVYLDDDLRHRPARVDRKTLRVTPVQLGGNLSRDQRMINTAITYSGKDQGKLVFLQCYIFDEASGQIRLRPPSANGNLNPISDPLPEAMPRSNENDQRNTTAAWPDGLRTGIRASAWSDRWPSDAVWAVVFDDARQQEWLCVGAGLAVLPRGGTALRHFGKDEGVCCGPVLDGVELGGKLFFASGWDDSRGGLTVFDPQTRVFTSYFRSDGLDSDKIVGLAVNDGQLELHYGVEYLRFNNTGNQRYRQYPAGLFDLTKSRFISGGKPEFPAQAEADQRIAPSGAGTLPLLGGPAYHRYQHDGRTWVCGSRGLVVFPGKTPPAAVFETLDVKRVPNLTKTLRDEAKQTPIPNPITVDQLKELVVHANRYVRANALATAINPVLQGGGEAFAWVLADCVDDPYRNVRSTAVWLLTKCDCAAALPPLRRALEDSDPGIRAVAALTLAKRGEVPPLAFFEEIIDHGNSYGNFPFGADSTIGVEADPVRAYAALAPHADRRIFELLVRRPPPNHDDIRKLHPILGKALLEHPDVADVLLAVYDADHSTALRDFSQGIFKHAGKEMLPVLHAALESKDRVVRSNAARSCGAIGDPSSIQHLIRALDLESGLPRASIVWALGELKASEAVPKLIALHQDARNAEHNFRAGAGYMAQQALTVHREEYMALRNLDAIASDWEELKAAALRRPRDSSRSDEESLKPEPILEAVRKIDAAAAAGL